MSLSPIDLSAGGLGKWGFGVRGGASESMRLDLFIFFPASVVAADGLLAES